MEAKSAPSKPRARRTKLAVAASVLVVLVAAFAVLDMSGEAEPSWVETLVASSLLQIKLRFGRQRRVSPIAPTVQDLERASELYQEQCGFCHGVARGRMAVVRKNSIQRFFSGM